MRESTGTTAVSEPGAAPAEADRDFSLVIGGPLFQLMRRCRLCDDMMGRIHRGVGVAVAITWAPLLALSAAQGSAWGASRSIPFLNDIECHLRFLVAVPLMLVAEVIVHRRLRPLLDQFSSSAA